jgi:hypothetical protein
MVLTGYAYAFDFFSGVANAASLLYLDNFPGHIARVNKGLPAF